MCKQTQQDGRLYYVVVMLADSDEEETKEASVFELSIVD